MTKPQISETIDHDRRRLLGTVAIAVAATPLGLIGSRGAQAATTRQDHVPAIKPGTHTSFAPLKQVNTDLLSIGYAEAGPANGPVVVLLHGWPYDIHSFVDVAPLLASAGSRVIVPFGSC